MSVVPIPYHKVCYVGECKQNHFKQFKVPYHLDSSLGGLVMMD